MDLIFAGIYLLVGWLAWVLIKDEFEKSGDWRQDIILFTCIFFWPLVILGLIVIWFMEMVNK